MRYMFDDYILDTRPYELWCKGKHVKLRPTIFEVLAYLICYRDRVVSKDELLEHLHLWPNQFIGDGTLNACLMAVCKAVGDSGQVQRRIQTFHKHGYRFVAMVEEADHTPLDRTVVSTEHPTQEDEAPIQDHAAVAATPTWALGADEVCRARDGSETPLPVPVCMVQGMTQRRAGVPRRGTPPRNPFVGRVQELAMLHERLAQAERGQGQLMGITGEPGLGKSRLLTEFRCSVQGRQVTCLDGQCLPYGRAMLYFPVLTLLRQRCGITDSDPPDAIHAKVQRVVKEAHVGSEEMVAFLLQLLDVQVDPALPAPCSPEVRKARIFAALRRVIVHRAQQPLLLVVEDVHWIDPTSEVWLAALVPGLADRALLLLVTYRPRYQPPWIEQSCVTRMALPPLSPQDSLMVAQAVPQTAQVPESLRQAIVAKAAGNPFFFDELARSVAEPGAVDTPLRIPDTVQAVLTARIDRLPPEAKHRLQLAAVIGPEVAFPLLQAVADLAEEPLFQQLCRDVGAVQELEDTVVAGAAE
jgi:DNA-binding winged helix-turn-helix (wHTH) protein